MGGRPPLLALWLCLLAAPPAFPQTISASLEGTVQDPSGALIPGAKVQVVNTATNLTTKLETGADGRFVAPSLPPGGPYVVIVEASGFKKVERSGIVLEVNQTASMAITMEVGAVSQTVEVSGQPPLLEATTRPWGR